MEGSGLKSGRDRVEGSGLKERKSARGSARYKRVEDREQKGSVRKSGRVLEEGSGT